MIWSVAFSPDGKTLATGSWDHTAKLWDPDTGSLRATLSGHEQAVRFLVFSPDQRDPDSSRLATAGFDGDIRLWNVAPGRPQDGVLVSTHHVTDGGLSCLAFSPDGQVLAVGLRPSWDGIRPDDILLYDVRDWKRIGTGRLTGHRHGVLSLAFSPDGKTLASGGGTFDEPGNNGEVFLWDVTTHTRRAKFTQLKFWVESLIFGHDGQTVISAGGVRDTGGEIRFWPAWPISASPIPD